MEADTDFLCAVYTSTRAEELAFTDWGDEQKAQFCAMQFHAQNSHYRQHYPTAQYFVILHKDVPVGRLYVDHWDQEIRVMDIALIPDFRGEGIGTLVLRLLHEQAEVAGKILSIHVEGFNPAKRLYQRMGFHLAEDKGVHQLMEWKPLK
jgi:GNAT superfamily N-acetyltransferase